MCRKVKNIASKILKILSGFLNGIRLFFRKITVLERMVFEVAGYKEYLHLKSNEGRHVVKIEKEKKHGEASQAVATSEINDNLATYLNTIFEQQEKDRIVRWLVNGIRESLDLEEVLGTIVDEIGNLLSVDRCLIALYDSCADKFSLKNEYRKDENISSVLSNEEIFNDMPFYWHKKLVGGGEAVIVNSREEDNLHRDEFEYLNKYCIESIIIIPIINKGNILGALSVHQLYYPREWERGHVEILYDTSSQIAVAISQAILYLTAQQATRLKSEFLASMSHELRTPLNSIIGFSDMLLSEDFGSLNTKQKKFLNNVSISGKHLLRLVNDILDLSKIESGNMELHYESFNAGFKISESISILKGLAHSKSIKIKSELQEGVIISADSRRFSQIMYNLISNSIKFTEDGGHITVKTSVLNGKLKVEVIDTGIGISEADKDKIFKKFMQLDSSYTRKQEGTGLGLALTRSLVDLHKGEINFSSVEGEGSNFWFIIPGAKLSDKLHTG